MPLRAVDPLTPATDNGFNALEALSTWFGRSKTEIRAHVCNSDLQYLSSALQIAHTPPFQRLTRWLIGLPLAKLPATSRRRMTTVLKRFRHPKRTVAVHDVESFLGTQLMHHLTQQLGLPEWNEATWAICVTHDVDDITGWNAVPEIARIDAEAGLRTTFNFLVGADYDLTPSILEELRDYGHEIGLHGWIHDIGLAYRSPKIIQETLSLAKACLPDVRGFRSPALSVSQNLFRCLDRAGIQYDSTLQVGCTFYKSVEVCIPYRLPGLRLWELPLLIQDDIFLRDAVVGESDIMPLVDNLLDPIKAYGGVAVINLHPHLMVSRLPLYRRLANWLGNLPDATSLAMYEALRQVIVRSSGTEGR